MIESALKNDTGVNRGQRIDNITSDPVIVGTLAPRERVHKLKGRFHGTRSFVDVSSVVQPNGEFLLDMATLERILEGRLDDGPYGLHLEVEDQYESTLDSTDIAFTLDTTPPVPVLFEPRNRGSTSLQLGFIDVAFIDSSDIELSTIKPSNLTIRNENKILRVTRAEQTSDGLFRYYYEGEFAEGVVTVTFAQGQVSDIASNFNKQEVQSFEFVLPRSMPNGMAQRPRRLQMEPVLNPAYNEDSGGSVYLHSGEAFLRRVDLEIPGRGIDFRFERTYRSGWFKYPGDVTSGRHEWRLGHKWDFNYNRRLFIVPPPGEVQDYVQKTFPDAIWNDVVLIDGRGREDLYRATEGGLPYVSPPGLFTTLTHTPNRTRFIERDQHGNVITYERVVGGGEMYYMTSFADRNGNTMHFFYDGAGLLRYVIDTLRRRIEFFYNNGLLSMVRDFIGREIVFSYDADGNLEAVTGPHVLGTPHGNDFPKGKTEKYTYDSGQTNVYLAHNLLTVTAPNEVARGGSPREIYVYNEDGRVVEQTYGGTNNSGVPAGGTFRYYYYYLPPLLPSALFALVAGTVNEIPPVVKLPEIPKTVVIDRNGNRTSYEFNELGNWTRIREFTNGLRPFDPPYYYELHKYSKDGQRLTVTHHELNKVEYTFDTTSEDPFTMNEDPLERLQQGNLRQMRRLPKWPDGNGGDQTQLVTKYSYEPIYNQRREVVEARGNDLTYRPSIALKGEEFPSAERYTTRYVFDYQEGTNYVDLAEKMGTTTEKVRELLEKAGVDMGLGDVNGDGRTNQIAGNVIRIEHPAVNLLEDSNQAKVEGTTVQQIVELFAYNDFGQLIRQTDPEGNATTYEYYSERDPDGDGVINGWPLGDPVTGGYLKQVTRDMLGDPNRNSGINPPPASIRTIYRYDPVGNVIQQIDGRGVVTDYVVNELNQVVQMVRDAGSIPPLVDLETPTVVNEFIESSILPVVTSTSGSPTTVAPALRWGFKYIERYWYDFNNNLVIHQKEDRGNTSNVDGNPPLQGLPIGPLVIDFMSTSAGNLETYSEKGLIFTPTRASNGGEVLGGGTYPHERLEFMTTGGGGRGLKLSSHLGNQGVRFKREDGAPFTLASITIASSEAANNNSGQWLVVSSAGGRQVLNSGTVPLLGPGWADIISAELVPIADPGDLVIDDLEIYPTPDPVGGDSAFADTVYKYDILDNRISITQEVQNGESPHFLGTLYRYDANENLVLTIFPEGNASTIVYDERDLRFRQGHGEHHPEMNTIESGHVTALHLNDKTVLINLAASWTTDQWVGHFVRITGGRGKGQFRRIVSNVRTGLTVRPAWEVPPDVTSAYEIGKTFALLHPDDPIDYDVRGGLSCSCSSYSYDGNRNVVEVVDAADTDLSSANNNSQLGPGDRTRHIYDGFDRLVSTIDSIGNQIVYQYDPAGNRVRELRFGPTGGPSPTSDGPDVLPGPVSIGGVIQGDNLVNANLLAATEYMYDELNRRWQTDRALFVNTIPTTRTPDVADGALDLGKGNLTSGDNQGIPDISGVTIIGRVSTRSEFDRKSRQTFTIEDDGDTFRTFYDGVDRVIKTVDPEGNTVESAYDPNDNLVEVRRIEISQEATSGAGILQTGQSTGSNGVLTLNDTMQSWHRFEWAGRTLRITGGTGAGQARRIVDNTSNQLTVDRNWDVIPDNTSSYGILAVSLLDSGQSTGFNMSETLNDAAKTWADNDWSGRTVEITGGTGAGQVRKILANNPFQLFVNPDWDVIPDITSQYAIYPRLQPGIAEVFLTTNFYDRLNRLELQIDNLGQSIYYRYDSRGNLVAKADAKGPTSGAAITRRAFSNGPLTVNTMNGFGNVTRYYYDGINRQTRQEIFLTASGSGDGLHIGATVEGIKGNASNPQSFPPTPDTTQGGGDGIIRIGTVYDDNSLTTAHIDDRGNVTLYLYDNLDRRVTETKGLTTAAAGVSLNKPLILGTRNIVTPEVASIDDPAIISADKINAQLAGARASINNVAQVFPSLADQIDEQPTTIIYGYGVENNLLIMEDENGTKVFFRYDAINRPIAVRVFRAGQADSHVGDPVFAPNPVSAPASPSGVSQPVIGTTKQNLQYDGLSRLVMATDNNDPLDDADDSLVTFAYDSLGRIIEESQQIGALAPKVVSSGWRADNLRSALTFPNGRVNRYSYDILNRIKSIAADTEAQSLVEYRYMGPGRLLERLYPINGTRLTHLDNSSTNDIGYDGLGRPTVLRHLHSDNSTVIGFSHNYDRMNNKLIEEKLHAAGNSELYRYDSLYRLIQFERGTLNNSKDAIDSPSAIVPQHGTWNLDEAGNWVSVGTETREHSSFNEITTRNSAGNTPTMLAYDNNGDLTDDGAKVFGWDFENRLRRVRHKSNAEIIADYSYDALGRRIRKIVTNSGPLDGITSFAYDGLRIIEEYRGAADLLSQQYVYGNYIDEVLIVDRNLNTDGSAIGAGDQRLFYHQNSLMHVCALTDTGGTIVEGYQYDAYGQHTIYKPGQTGAVEFGGDDIIILGTHEPSGVGNPYLFTGRRVDTETSLLYYRARYFAPDLGRFISRDPIGCWTNMRNLGNPYSYVGNNPVMRLDPLGLGEAEPVVEIDYRWGEGYFDPDTGQWCQNQEAQTWTFTEDEGGTWTVSDWEATGLRRCEEQYTGFESPVPVTTGDHPLPLPPPSKKKNNVSVSKQRQQQAEARCQLCRDEAERVYDVEFEKCSTWGKGIAGGVLTALGLSGGKGLLRKALFKGSVEDIKVSLKDFIKPKNAWISLALAGGGFFVGITNVALECEKSSLKTALEKVGGCKRECGGIK